MKKIILMPLLFSLVSLGGCSMLAFAPMEGAEVVKSTFPEKLSEKASKEQQEEVKKEVMRLLEEEYKQPFKLESFDYKYETHASSNSLPATYSKYGIYYFKVKTINNSILDIDIQIKDDNKESIKSLIDSFKKNQLNTIYCGTFDSYYRDYLNSTVPKGNEKDIKKTKKYCDSRNQTSYKRWDDIFKDK